MLARAVAAPMRGLLKTTRGKSQLLGRKM